MHDGLRRGAVREPAVHAGAATRPRDGRDAARAHAGRPAHARACWSSAAAPARTWPASRPPIPRCARSGSTSRRPRSTSRARPPRRPGSRTSASTSATCSSCTDGQLGEFDYVIVHGLYAWAHEPLREAVLAACRSHLAPDGIAYVSYNAHPGGHLRQMLREMAQWHARGLQDPRERAERARGLFALLDRLRRGGRPVVLRGRRRRGGARARQPQPSRRSSTTCSAAAYAPVWFADFAAAAARHGLGLRRRRDPGGQPGAAVVGGASRRSSPTARATTASRASSTSTCSCCGASATRCSATTGRAPSADVDRGGVPRLLVRPDGDLGELPEPLRSALDGVAARPVPFAELRERAGLPDGRARRAARARRSTSARSRSTPSRRPRPPHAGRAPARERARAQPGARRARS